LLTIRIVGTQKVCQCQKQERELTAV